MTNTSLTHDELAVLSALYENYPQPLGSLRFGAGSVVADDPFVIKAAPFGDPRVGRLRSAVIGLFRKGLVDILRIGFQP